MLPLISDPFSFLQTFVYICVFASVAALVLVAVYFAVRKYREVQLDFTPEIEVFHMLFEGCHTKNRRSLKQQMKCTQFRLYELFAYMDHFIQIFQL